MSGRCDHCGAAPAGIYELALIRVDDHMVQADAVVCARMAELCPACRDRLADRVAQLLPVWDRAPDAPVEDDGVVTLHPRVATGVGS